MHPHGAAPLDAALLQKHNQAVGMGDLLLDHGHDVVWHAICFSLARLEDESGRVYEGEVATICKPVGGDDEGGDDEGGDCKA